MPKEYFSDFETRNHPDDSTIWAWGLLIGEKFEYGIDLESYIERIKKLPDGALIYFHNLSFDGYYILKYFMENDYVYESDIKDSSFDIFSLRHGSIYSITFYTKGKKITFKDTYKMYPISVKKMGDSLGDISKGVIDYNADRPHGYQPSLDELTYLKNDMLIVQKFHNQYKNTLKNIGINKIQGTIGSNSIQVFNKLCKNWDLNIYDLSTNEENLCRKAYRGGMTYLNPLYKDKVIEKHIKRYDINSMYPYIMYSKPLPYGKPKEFFGEYVKDTIYPYYIQEVTVSLSLKPGKIPFLTTKGNRFFSGTCIEDCEMYTTSLTSPEIKIIFDVYDVNYIEYHKGLKFRTKNNIFKNYIDYWYTVKKTAESIAERQISKFHLNSLYGKFAIDYTRYADDCFMDKSIVKFKEKQFFDCKKPSYAYIPISCAITSYARCYLYENISSLKNKDFIYCDTDSIHTFSEIPAGILDDFELGKFKDEGMAITGKYLREKCYALRLEKKDTKGNNIIKAAITGLSGRDGVTPENLVFGAKYLTRRKRKVPTGLVIEEKMFEILS